MANSSKYFRFTIALLIAGSAISLISCGNSSKTAEISDEKIISRTIHDMEAFMSKNGERIRLMRAPLVEEHKFAKSAFEEYPKGIEVISYDSLGSPSQRIIADYALHWMALDLWELKGNVLAEGDGGLRKFYTQQLYYDAKLKKIWSNVDSKIEDGGSVYYPEGFEALDDFSFYEFRGMTGTMEVDVEPVNDSTAVAPTASPVDGQAAGPPVEPSTPPTVPAATSPASKENPAPAEQPTAIKRSSAGGIERRANLPAGSGAMKFTAIDTLTPSKP